MKRIKLFIAINVLAAFLNSPIVFADARVATANDQVWGGTGIPAGGANVTQAAAGDTLNINGYRVYITNDQTANDGSGLNIFLAEDNSFKIDIVDYNIGVVFIVISYEGLNGRIFEFSFAMRE